MSMIRVGSRIRPSVRAIAQRPLQCSKFLCLLLGKCLHFDIICFFMRVALLATEGCTSLHTSSACAAVADRLCQTAFLNLRFSTSSCRPMLYDGHKCQFWEGQEAASVSRSHKHCCRLAWRPFAQMFWPHVPMF